MATPIGFRDAMARRPIEGAGINQEAVRHRMLFEWTRRLPPSINHHPFARLLMLLRLRHAVALSIHADEARAAVAGI